MMVEATYFTAARRERERSRDKLTEKEEKREIEQGLRYHYPSL